VVGFVRGNPWLDTLPMWVSRLDTSGYLVGNLRLDKAIPSVTEWET